MVTLESFYYCLYWGQLKYYQYIKALQFAEKRGITIMKLWMYWKIYTIAVSDNISDIVIMGQTVKHTQAKTLSAAWRQAGDKIINQNNSE